MSEKADQIINEDVLRQMVVDAIKKGGITINIPIDKIRSIVVDTANDELVKFQSEGAKILSEASRLTSCTQKVEIISNGKTKQSEGLFHRDFAHVLSLTTARNPVNKFPIGLWLWGGAGAGKTHMAEQMAEQMEVPFYPIYGGPTMTETKLLGYRNAGAGVYVKGLTYDWYKGGGLLTIDEADLGESLACMNSLFANRVYRFPDGELIERHPDTYFIALANTNGMGAKLGFRRNVQDVAALDRFNFWQFHYDEKLEKALAGGFSEFADYVVSVRKWLQGNAKETNIHVTPRSTMRGVALLASTNMDGPEIAEASIFGLFPKDTKDSCLKAVGKFTRKGVETTPAEEPARKKSSKQIIKGGYADAMETVDSAAAAKAKWVMQAIEYGDAKNITEALAKWSKG